MKRCYITTAVILLTGFAAAVAIYVTAGDVPENPLEEYENTKSFARSVEVIGGKSALLANDLGKWFSGLWHGQQFAFTVAVITVVVAVVYYFIASGTGDDTEN